MNIQCLIDIFQALGNNVRFKILTTLMEQKKKMPDGNGLCVCDLVRTCKTANSTMTHHLDWLKSVRLLKSEKKGRWIYYDVNIDMINKIKDSIEKMLGGLK